jgi:hypothetical protein
MMNGSVQTSQPADWIVLAAYREPSLTLNNQSMYIIPNNAIRLCCGSETLAVT